MAKMSKLTRINTVITREMVVACTNSDGDPDLFFCKVTGTPDQILAGKHYGAAKRCASNEDNGGHMVAFDCEDDAAGEAMKPLFTWETCSGITIK